MLLDVYGRIAVVGATGAVGREALAILAERGVPGDRVAALASARSAGSVVAYGEDRLRVVELSGPALAGAGLVLLCATSAVSREWAWAAAEVGALVVDNSAAWRQDERVPLVVPGVNDDALRPDARVIANANCSTIILVSALEPLRRAFGVERVHVATYQAVSGAGAAAIEELRRQASCVLSGEVARPTVFAEPCAFNVFSHNSAVDPETGLNGEERKIIAETRRVWGLPGLRVTPTCVRVPVVRAHTEAVTVRLGRAASEAEVRGALLSEGGLEVIDDRVGNRFPTPLKATGRDAVLVGRVRADPGEPVEGDGRTRGWSLLVCADQLRTGAALSAVRIAERYAKFHAGASWRTSEACSPATRSTATPLISNRSFTGRA